MATSSNIDFHAILSYETVRVYSHLYIRSNVCKFTIILKIVYDEETLQSSTSIPCKNSVVRRRVVVCRRRRRRVSPPPVSCFFFIGLNIDGRWSSLNID